MYLCCVCILIFQKCPVLFHICICVQSVFASVLPTLHDSLLLSSLGSDLWSGLVEELCLQILLEQGLSAMEGRR